MLEQKLKAAPPANAPLLLLVRYRLENLKGKKDAAATALQQAVAMKDTPYTTASMLVNFLIADKQYDAAEQYAREGGKASKEERRQLLRSMAHAGMEDTQLPRRLRLIRELLETPDQNVDYDRQQLVGLLVSSGKMAEAEKEVRAMKNSRDNWAVQNAWNNLINHHQNKQNYADALRLARELVASESDDDNTGRRNNAMNMLMNVASQAIRQNKLDAQTREICIQEIVKSASDYFNEKNTSPPWHQLGHDDIRKFGMLPAIDKLAAEAAASNQPQRISLAAQYYQNNQRYDEAVRLFKRALALPDADERNIGQQLYSAYMSLDNRIPWGDAIDLIEKLYQLKAYDENSYRMERVRCLYALKRRDDARVEVKKLMESRQYWRNGHWGMQNLAGYCQTGEDWTMAVEVWELALRLFRKNGRNADMHSAAQLYVSCANAYSRAGEGEKSIDCFLRGMSLIPRNHESYRYLMDEALRQIIKDGAIDRIVAEYEKKVKAGAGDKPHLRIAFAEAYKRSNNEKKALENLRVAADMLPKDMTLRKQVIDGYKALGDNETALASYRDWAKLDPQNIDIYNGMGDLYHTLGQRDNALLAWATMAEVRPREAEGYRAYAQKLIGIRMHAQAAVALRQAVKYRPTVFDISSELAQVYRTLGQNDQVAPLWNEGEKACRKAMEDFADDPLPWLSLGRFLDAAGKKSEARKVFTDILNRQWPRFQNETHQEARERTSKL
jgi:tetratricopeptide (TPR) repeat protein